MQYLGRILLFLVITFTALTLTLLLQTAASSSQKFSKNPIALKNESSLDFNFAAVGDWGCTNDTKSMVNNIIAENPELVLGLGDYAYRDNAGCWLNIIDQLDHKLKIVIGNHDAKKYVTGKSYPSEERLNEYMNHFNLTSQFYSFDYGNVHFVAMSTEVPFGKDSLQYQFVKNDLEKTKSEQNNKWIIVFYHRTAYASPTSAGSGIPLLINTYHPLFEKYKVDLVVQAHSHSYQRSYPIKYNSENSSKPFIMDNNKENYNDPEGQIYAIVGTGGVGAIHNFTGPSAKYMAIQFKAFGFLNLNILNNGSTIVGKFQDNNGSILDRFSITKSKINESNSSSSLQNKPILSTGEESKFKIETIFSGLRSPTDIAFLDTNDIIVLEKNNGTVQRIVNGQLLDRPLLDVNVANKNERGLLGVAISRESASKIYVFLYYTETNKESSDICPKANYCLPGTDPIGNRLYRYELSPDGMHLFNPKLLLDLPAVPGPAHNGGKLLIGPDKNLFVVIGDLMGHKTKAENYKDSLEPDLTGGILHVSKEGDPLDDGYLGNKYPLNLYYAYGIRNSFGMDFDPVTGELWDTENGPGFGDEINLVKPGFNSGWKAIQGIWEHKRGNPENKSIIHDNLEDFNGRGKYSSPEFTFYKPVGVTAIKFFNSEKMGLEYKNDIFVGDIKSGLIYRFDLDLDRRSLVLDGNLTDKIANSPEELNGSIFAKGFSGISDMEVGPDGYLYILSYGKGTIYRIIPK